MLLALDWHGRACEPALPGCKQGVVQSQIHCIRVSEGSLCLCGQGDSARAQPLIEVFRQRQHARLHVNGRAAQRGS
jgi:hypothetical protein